VAFLPLGEFRQAFPSVQFGNGAQTYPFILIAGAIRAQRSIVICGSKSPTSLFDCATPFPYPEHCTRRPPSRRHSKSRKKAAPLSLLRPPLPFRTLFFLHLGKTILRWRVTALDPLPNFFLYSTNGTRRFLSFSTSVSFAPEGFSRPDTYVVVVSFSLR